MPTTLHPLALAICAARPPTAPAADETRTVSPACTAATSRMPIIAARPMCEKTVSPTANGTPGMRCTLTGGTICEASVLTIARVVQSARARTISPCSKPSARESSTSARTIPTIGSPTCSGTMYVRSSCAHTRLLGSQRHVDRPDQELAVGRRTQRARLPAQDVGLPGCASIGMVDDPPIHALARSSLLRSPSNREAMIYI